MPPKAVHKNNNGAVVAADLLSIMISKHQKAPSSVPSSTAPSSTQLPVLSEINGTSSSPTPNGTTTTTMTPNGTTTATTSTQSTDGTFIKVYTYSHHDKKWKVRLRQPREFATVTLPSEQKADLLSDLHDFKQKRDWYHANNIPYRRGYFLYGPPGTGKTSIGTAIATETSRPIYFMPPDLDIDAVTSISDDAVILLEDADKMITNKDTVFRQVEPEPVPVTTSYPTINPDEHHIWLKAIRSNENIINKYQNEYMMYDANFDSNAAGGITLLDTLVEGTLTDMKAGYAEPRPAVTKRREVTPGVFEDRLVEPEESDKDYKARRLMYKNIIKEANRLRREHYDSVRFDQERIGVLLQIVDGALTPYGAIFVMTTNKRHDIHTAMLRAGRMDKVLEIGYLNEDNAVEMLSRLGVPLSFHTELLNTIRVPGRALNITAADLQGAIIDWKKSQ